MKKSLQKQLLSFITSNTRIDKIIELLSSVEDHRDLDTESITDPKNYNESPLIFHALRHRRKDMPELLQAFFAKGVDPLVTYNDRTLLHEAAGSQGVETIDFLLDRGLDVNARDDLGMSPLFMAALEQQEGFEIIRQLVEAGADPDIVDNNGESVLDMVISQRYSEEKYYLLENELIDFGLREGAEIKEGEKKIWKKSKDQSKGFVYLRKEILNKNNISVNTNEDIFTPSKKPSNYLADPNWLWREITTDRIKELLYHPVKYREQDDILDRRNNHFNVGTLVSIQEEEQTCTIVEQWESGSAGATFSYGEKSYLRPLAAIGRAYLGRREKA